MMQKLEKTEYHSFYQTYIDQIDKNDLDIIENLKESFIKAESLFNDLDIKKQMFQYAPGKWTIKEIIQHLCDAERVFNYRALRVARNDAIGLAGFEQNDYVLNSNANSRSFENLKEEFIALRKNTICLYKSFTEGQLILEGSVGNNSMSVRALGYITSGHLLHHLNVINNKYL